jgi:hypothetical protein
MTLEAAALQRALFFLFLFAIFTQISLEDHRLLLQQIDNINPTLFRTSQLPLAAIYQLFLPFFFQANEIGLGCTLNVTHIGSPRTRYWVAFWQYRLERQGAAKQCR